MEAMNFLKEKFSDLKKNLLRNKNSEGQFEALKRDDNSGNPLVRQRNHFDDCRSKVVIILKSLYTQDPQEEYDPQQTIDAIKKYIGPNERGNRIIYSEITNRIYSLSDHEKGTIITNLESLICYVADHADDIDEKVEKICIKLCDHVNLACYQADHIKHELINQAQAMQNNFNEMEKEYISILGIFSSVVLTFVAGSAFSSSVLQNLHKASSYRIIVSILLIGLVLINALYLMFVSIERIVYKDRPKQRKGIVAVNILIVLLIIGTIVCWWNGTVEKRNDTIGKKYPSSSISDSASSDTSSIQEESPGAESDDG